MVSIASFSPLPPFRKLLFSACFRFLIFHPFFQVGQLTPFAPMCGRPCLDVHLMSSRVIKFNIDPFKCAFYVACNSIYTYSNGVDEMTLFVLQETIYFVGINVCSTCYVSELQADW